MKKVKKENKLTLEGTVTLDFVHWNDHNKVWDIGTNPWKDHELPAFDVWIGTKDDDISNEFKRRIKEGKGLQFKVVITEK